LFNGDANIGGGAEGRRGEGEGVGKGWNGAGLGVRDGGGRWRGMLRSKVGRGLVGGGKVGAIGTGEGGERGWGGWRGGW